MRTLKQSTSYDLMVFVADSTDHITGKAGLTLTITASKAGGAFASITPTVTERGSGWYSLALTASHTDTQGDLAIHVTGTGADPADVVMQVRGNVLGDTLPASVQSMAADTVTASALATDAVNEIQTGLATAASLATVAGYVDTEVAAILSAVTALPTAAQVAAAVLAAGDVDGFSLEETLKLCLAALAGKISGAGTTTIVIRAADDTANRITAVVDNSGNRLTVTLNAAG